jgi:hypothetical protein
MSKSAAAPDAAAEQLLNTLAPALAAADASTRHAAVLHWGELLRGLPGTGPAVKSTALAALGPWLARLTPAARKRADEALDQAVTLRGDLIAEERADATAKATTRRRLDAIKVKQRVRKPRGTRS